MYKEHYENAKKQLEQTREQMLSEIAKRIDKYHKYINIGNMQYYVCDDPYTHKLTPAYRYLNEHTEFDPMYDRNQTYDYGWADFESVARLLDLISDFLLSKGI